MGLFYQSQAIHGNLIIGTAAENTYLAKTVKTAMHWTMKNPRTQTFLLGGVPGMALLSTASSSLPAVSPSDCNTHITPPFHGLSSFLRVGFQTVKTANRAESTVVLLTNQQH